MIINNKNKYNFLKYNTITIILISIIIIIIVLYSNYYYGKQFNICKKCNINEVFFIDVKLLPEKLIKLLEFTIKKNGSRLNPELNFNNAKGKKLNYNQIPKEIINFYDNNYLERAVSEKLGENVYFADKNEHYRIFARLYEDEDDFLDWHYDNNFTIGNRYTLVIPILVDKGNTSEFMIKDRKTGIEKIIPISLGKGVIYNGSITYHKISEQTNGQRRLVIIIPFYSNYKKTFFGKIREFFRNITYKLLTL